MNHAETPIQDFEMSKPKTIVLSEEEPFFIDCAKKYWKSVKHTFSIDGRIGRKEYIQDVLSIFVVMYLACLFFQKIYYKVELPLLLSDVFITLICGFSLIQITSLTIKRAHDFGKAGWTFFLILVALFIELTNLFDTHYSLVSIDDLSYEHLFILLSPFFLYSIIRKGEGINIYGISEKELNFYMDLKEKTPKTLKEFVRLAEKFQKNPLVLASFATDDTTIIEELVSEGADINDASEGITPLMIASRFNSNIEIVKKLVALNANTKLKDKQGRTFISYMKSNTTLSSYAQEFKG